MKSFTLLRLTLFLAFICGLISCAGGGTSGTGLKTFTGVARTISGEPVAGVEVALANSEAQSTTDTSGTYIFQAEIGAGTVQVDVANADQINSIEVPNLPAGDVEVTIDITVNEETRAATAVSVEVRPIDSTPPPSRPRDDNPSPTEPTAPVPDDTSDSGEQLTLIRGVLLDADGIPRVGVRVFSEVLGITVVTDENGEFSIEGIIEDEQLSLQIGTDEDATQSNISLDPSTSSLSLILQTMEEEDGTTTLLPEISAVETREEEVVDPTTEIPDETDPTMDDPTPTDDESPETPMTDEPVDEDPVTPSEPEDTANPEEEEPPVISNDPTEEDAPLGDQEEEEFARALRRFLLRLLD